jgi:ferric-dicitrate binding protein FerR (iron transport regulator)
MEQAADRPGSKVGRVLALGFGLVAGIALGVVGVRQVSKAEHAIESGARLAEQRETVRVGQRAVLVLEPGTAVHWRALGEALVVEQSSGEVFYRVEVPPFHVRTPFGVVRATSTCFQVAVNGGGSDGQEQLSVLVYEGRVSLSRGNGDVDLGPGDRGLVTGGGAPMRLWRGPPAVQPTPEPTAAEDP